MSQHDHAHDHSGHGHDHHDHAHGASERRLLIAAGLTGVFMVVEAAGGWLSGSLALLADAGHMLVDFAGLLLALFAARLARRPADARRSFGYDRFSVLVAYTNGLVLFAIAGFILYEAWERLADPAPVLAGPMLAVAIAGLLVNIGAFFALHGGDAEDLNLRGALLHVLGDLLGSVAAILAAIVIFATGWTPIDPILSVLVCLLILGNAARLVRQSAHVLLEGAPAGVDGPAVARHLETSVPGVADVHHVHVWMLTPQRRAATLHACVADGAAEDTVVRIKTELRERFAIGHATVEIERGACADAGSDACAGGTTRAHDGHDHHHHAGGRHDHDHEHGHAHAAPPRFA
ncbi:cation diffusion facilitator family transporter [Aureimonas jatrophae]|uniref:Cobalt-zinc-cadmium efflux system protein n=1 Tax=Aureimonas jatrophae TaxID=1166073 RepID=A0A1H0LUW4_9HYPH|nr:cation diffusion facilitator family transporter [Aureimonas jatrophae]MBB3952759.1 cobalt-zinc-cadmium efflux system protein [Aureimonas jatrophae]SDO71947.1 cobalt-zinc-cadmium efflux system protein [Aureimonas jatrophae]